MADRFELVALAPVDGCWPGMSRASCLVRLGARPCELGQLAGIRVVTQTVNAVNRGRRGAAQWKTCWAFIARHPRTRLDAFDEEGNR